jgi:hypothetical protein
MPRPVAPAYANLKIKLEGDYSKKQRFMKANESFMKHTTFNQTDNPNNFNSNA